MIKGSIQEEDITIINIYAPSIGAPQCIRQMLTAINGEISSSVVIMEYFKTPLSSVDILSRWKISKEVHTLNDTLDQMDNILAVQIQYIRKIIHHDQAGFIPGMQKFFNIHKSISVIHHINKLKNKNHMVFLISAEKLLTKFNTNFW